MALSEELPIYADLCSLSKLYCDQWNHLPKEIRQKYGYQLLDCCIEMKVMVFLINSSAGEEKQEAMRRLQIKYHYLKETNRTCTELQAFSSKGAADNIDKLMAKIGRHVTRWSKSRGVAQADDE